MNNPLIYIEDALKAGELKVKILVNGVVTEADPKTALEQLKKTKIQRKGYWSLAEPYADVVEHKNKTAAKPIQEAEHDVVEESTEGEVSKKKKKTNEQTHES